MKYYVSCGGTVSGDFIANTLDEAMQLSDEHTAYTQRDIFIYEIHSNDDEPNNCVAIRRWWGVPFDDKISDDLNPIRFGHSGYYSDWE